MTWLEDGRLEKKYITFRLIESKPKTTVWEVVNNNSLSRLGMIEWYSTWRQYVFCPTSDTVFNNSCLQDIIEVLNGLNTYQWALAK